MGKLQLQQVGKAYGKRPAVLQDISMHINDGEFVVILGPSGCGKSSLLRMVAGLEPVTHGEIRIDDRRVNELEPGERDIAMVFQNYALYPHMTVYQNMAYSLKIQRLSSAEIDQRVRQTADSLGLTGLLSRRPRELSGGQRQRVAIGRAIVRQPAVFLFDEPLSNLDARLRVQMRLELEQLHRRLQTTCLYVTHDQVEAMTLADRIMILNAGHIEQIGTPMEVYHYPASVFVAGFIGSPPMNLLPLHGRAGRWWLDHTDTPAQGDERLIPLLLPLTTATQEGPCTWGVRPEHIRLVAHGVGLGTLQIEVIESLGAEAYAWCRWHGHRITVRLPGDHPWQAGQSATFQVDEQQMHWFDRDSGLRRYPYSAV